MTAAVTFSPASPVEAETSVTATVTLTGTAAAAGTHTIDLTSAKANLTTNPQTETVTAEQNLTTTPATKTFSFIMPARAVDDFTLNHTFEADGPFDGTFDINAGTGTGSGWGITSDYFRITTDGSYLVEGTGEQTNSYRICVNTGVTATVTLDNVNLSLALPFECGANSNVTLILADNSENRFIGGGHHAGLKVPSTATLTITTAGQSLGNGALSAYGGGDSSSAHASAGIGGSELEPSGTIIIDGGTVFAKGGDGRGGTHGGSGGAGIGGAKGSSCGDITINGGKVTAIGGDTKPEGAGIGGGSSNPSNYNGKITINGGTVRAYSGRADSGGSSTGIGNCETIVISDTADVKAYSSGIYPAIYGTAGTEHRAYLLNLMLDEAVTQDTDITVTRADGGTETFEMVLPAKYNNFASTVSGANTYFVNLIEGVKYIAHSSDRNPEFIGALTAPGTAFGSAEASLVAIPVLTAGAVYRTSATEAMVRFVSDTAGVYYYCVSESATVPATDNLSGWEAGGALAAGTSISRTAAGLSSGAQYIHVVAVNDEGDISAAITFDIPSDYYYWENFEGYSLDTTLTSGDFSPLKAKYSGSGTAYQKVIQGTEGNTSQVLTLTSSSGTAADADISLGSDFASSGKTYAVEFKAQPISGSWPGEIRLMTSKNSFTDALVAKFKNGNISIEYQSPVPESTVTLIENYTAVHWYHIKIVVDTQMKASRVYIDGTLIDSFPAIGNYTYLNITAGHSGTIRFDDLKIYETDPIMPNPPLLQSAETSAGGEKVILTFDKEMANPDGKHSQFSVTVGGNTNLVTAAALGTDAKTLELTLTTAIRHGQAVTVSYTEGAVASADGGALASFTDQTVTNHVPEPVCAIGSREYGTLAEALADIAGDETIQLLADVSHAEAVKADSKNISIDLNGFDLTVSTTSDHALQAANGYKLTIVDAEQKGGAVAAAASGNFEIFAAYASSGGDIVVEGDLSVSPVGFNPHGIGGAYATGEGSTIRITGNVSGHSAGIYTQNSANVTVIGDISGGYYGVYAAYHGGADITGTVNGSRALVVEYAGSAKVEGSITGSDSAVEGATAEGWETSTIKVTGDVTCTGGAAISANNDADIEINGDVAGYATVSGSPSACPAVVVNGDISVDGGFGVSVFYGGTVTVNGQILGASPYLKLDNLDIARGDYEVSGDYWKYSNQTAETPAPFAANTVYVKKPVNPSASSVAIAGDKAVGEALNGSYTYQAGSVAAEGDTAFRWLRVSGAPSLLGRPYLVYTTNNIEGVTWSSMGPSHPTVFTVTGPTHIEKISNYHFNAGHAPGTISLAATGGTVYGPWNTVNEGGYWCVYPNAEVPAGTYTVVDSVPSSWSFNAASGDAGMTEIAGYTMIAGAVAQTYTVQASDAGHSLLFEVTPTDADGNQGTAARSTAFGPITAMEAIAEITGVTAAKTALASTGGDSVITVSGTNLGNAVTITAFLGGQATAVTGTAAGDGSAQTATLTFPANDGDADEVYTVKASLDNGVTWAAKTAAVTVAKKSVTPPDPAYQAEVKKEGHAETPLPITVDKDAGNAAAEIGAGQLTSGGTVITMPSIPDVDTYAIGIPVPDLSTDTMLSSLTVQTSYGSITVPSNMLTGVEGTGGDRAQISLGQGNKSLLPENVKAAIGDRPLIRLTLSIDGKQQAGWNNPSAPVTLSIPYTATEAELENPESIVVWYIDGSGNVATVPNGHYDAATGTVTFSITHFSNYAVAYNKVSFTDVAKGNWYHDAVSFIAAREITKGTAAGRFSPNASVTRGQVIVMLMRAYGILPDENPADNFADAGNAYYTKYLAAAKRLNLANGVGNNRFEPERNISRQELFTLVYNVLKSIDGLPETNSGKTLSHFGDAKEIAIWAKAPTAALVRAGIVQGNGQKLMPGAQTKRSEMAQILYNLMAK